jgi:hypothetical protein
MYVSLTVSHNNSPFNLGNIVHEQERSESCVVEEGTGAEEAYETFAQALECYKHVVSTVGKMDPAERESQLKAGGLLARQALDQLLRDTESELRKRKVLPEAVFKVSSLLI